jgi:hypothetical protein
MNMGRPLGFIPLFSLGLALALKGAAGAEAVDQGPAPTLAGQWAAADDARILITGRVDRTLAKVVRFDWPGVLIEANFTGSSITAVLSTGKDYFDVLIDGLPARVLETKAGSKDVVLADNLPAGPHHLALARRTESYQGVVAFEGLRLAGGGVFLPPPARPRHKIEFLGDSITAGFGVEGAGPHSFPVTPHSNARKAFAATASRQMDAECHLIAASGLGLVRNSCERTKSSAHPLPFFYDRTLKNEPSPAWDPASWVPDAIVVNLGTNDFSSEPKPDRAAFVGAFVALVRTLRRIHPAAQVFLCDGPVQASPFPDCLRMTLAAFNGDPQVHRITLNPPASDEFGCLWHPNEKAARRLAAELDGQMKPILGW